MSKAYIQVQQMLCNHSAGVYWRNFESMNSIGECAVVWHFAHLVHMTAAVVSGSFSVHSNAAHNFDQSDDNCHGV